MPLKKVFENDYDKLPWHLLIYEDCNGKQDVAEFLIKGIQPNQRERFMFILHSLAEHGPTYFTKPTFGTAGPKYRNYSMERIAVNQRRIYLSLDRQKKEMILIIGRNKKTQKTAKKHINEFQNTIDKIIKEIGEEK